MRKNDKPKNKLTFLKSTLIPFQQREEAFFFDSCRSTSRWSLSQLLNGTALSALITLLITQGFGRLIFPGNGDFNEQELKDAHLSIHNISNTILAVFIPVSTIVGALLSSVCTRRMLRLDHQQDESTLVDNLYFSGTLKSFGISGLTTWIFCTIMMRVNCFGKNDNFSQQVNCTRNWLNAELGLYAALFMLGLTLTVGVTCYVKKKVERQNDERIKLLDDDDVNSGLPSALNL